MKAFLQQSPLGFSSPILNGHINISFSVLRLVPGSHFLAIKIQNLFVAALDTFECVGSQTGPHVEGKKKKKNLVTPYEACLGYSKTSRSPHQPPAS